MLTRAYTILRETASLISDGTMVGHRQPFAGRSDDRK